MPAVERFARDVGFDWGQESRSQGAEEEIARAKRINTNKKRKGRKCSEVGVVYSHDTKALLG